MPSCLGWAINFPPTLCPPDATPFDVLDFLLSPGFISQADSTMFRLAAVFGAAVVGTLLSWVHFGGIWKGVVVSGAGDIGAVSCHLPHGGLQENRFEQRALCCWMMDVHIPNK